MFSAEAGLILVQGGLLVTRTLITDAISRIEARAARYLIAQVSVHLCILVNAAVLSQCPLLASCKTSKRHLSKQLRRLGKMGKSLQQRAKMHQTRFPHYLMLEF